MGSIYDGRPRVTHKIINGIETKKCTKCDLWKSLEEFNKKKDMSDGLRNSCRTCQSVDSKKYRENHKLEEKERAKNNRIKYKKYYTDYQRQWTRDNAEELRIKYQNRKAKNKNLPATLTVKQWKNAMEVFSYSCAYCKNGSCDLEIDHFVPITKDIRYGTTKENILPCCKQCNISKNNNYFEDWYKKKDFYDPSQELFILNYINDARNSKLIFKEV